MRLRSSVVVDSGLEVCDAGDEETSLKTRILCAEHNFVSCDTEAEMIGVRTAAVFNL
jgi:hypothetical protein